MTFSTEMWERREAACEAMEAIAVAFLDPATEAAGWFTTGWGHSVVEGREVREVREWLAVRADESRTHRLHDLLARAGVLGSTVFKSDGADFTPCLSWRPPAVEWSFTELGEGLEGDYDPADPDDVELLRLDATVDGEVEASACTRLPVSLGPDERAGLLGLAKRFHLARPDLGLRRVLDIFSYAEPAWAAMTVRDLCRLPVHL